MADFPYRFYFRQGNFEIEVEGDRHFVEGYVASIMKEEPEEKKPAKAAVRKAPAPKKAPAAGTAKTESQIPPVDAAALENYLKEHPVKTNKDRYLAYAGFLKTQGTPVVTNTHMKACFAAEKEDYPTTAHQNFSLLRKQKYMESAGERGTWKLTPAGEAALEAKPKKPAKAKPRAKAKRAPASKKAAPKAKAAGKRAAPEAAIETP